MRFRITPQYSASYCTMKLGLCSKNTKFQSAIYVFVGWLHGLHQQNKKSAQRVLVVLVHQAVSPLVHLDKNLFNQTSENAQVGQEYNLG